MENSEVFIRATLVHVHKLDFDDAGYDFNT